MKNFDDWNNKKKNLHQKNVKLYYHPREIWWCYLGFNIGSEQDGSAKKFLRPIVIIRAFGPDACLVVPLTTSIRDHALRISIGIVDGKQARANLSQIKVIDTKRLLEKISFMEKGVFQELRKAVKNLF